MSSDKVVLFVIIGFVSLVAYGKSVSSEDADLRVTTSGGVLLGKWMKADGGKPYRVFLRVPYAAPPKGPLRFKAPAPPLPWEGERDAKLEPPPCPQFEPYATKRFIGREDCLFLNVFTPQPSDKLRPVFVFVHGGSFRNGVSASFYYNPVFLMEGDIIVVTVSYRLNIFGFYTDKSEEAPGNLAVRDAIASLQWVQREIRNFGGDPGRVTVAGHSSGGVMVSSLLYLKEAKGLFSQAMVFGGTAHCPWAMQSAATEAASDEVAAIVGCDFDDPKKSLECMQKVKVLVLQKAAESLMEKRFLNLHWTPRVDVELKSPLFPRRISRDSEIVNKVPLIVGVAKEEGILHAASDMFSVKNLRKLNNSWLKDCPEYFAMDFPEPTRVKNACEAIRREYFGPNGEIDETKGFDFAEATKDRMFGVCSVDLADEMSAAGVPVYAYSFNYVQHNVSALDLGNLRRREEDLNIPELRGAVHTTDILTMFNAFGAESRTGEFGRARNKIMRKAYNSRILNFVEFGSPNGPSNEAPATPKWPTYEPSVGRHMVFDYFTRIATHLIPERKLEFWRAFENGLKRRFLEVAN